MDMSKGKSLNFGFNGGGQGGTSFEDLGYSQFSETETYAAGDVVIYDGSLYKFTASHSGAWTGTDATATSVEELFKEKADAIKVLTKEAQTLTDAEKLQARTNICAAKKDNIFTINGAEVSEGDEVIVGESGSIVIDDEMSDESENAVQNKVVKAYVDGSSDKQSVKGNGTTTASTLKFKVTEGRKYRVSIDPYDFASPSSLTAGYYVIRASNSSNERYFTILRYEPRKHSFEFTANDSVLVIEIRADEDIDVNVFVEDITDVFNKISVTSESVIGWNLLDLNKIVSGYIDNSNSGVVHDTTSKTLKVTDYIEVSEEGLYCSCATGYGTNRSAVYDKNKHYLRKLSSGVYEYEEGDGYVRFTIDNSQANKTICVGNSNNGYYKPYDSSENYLTEEILNPELRIKESQLERIKGVIAKTGGNMVSASFDTITGERKYVGNFPKYLKLDKCMSLCASVTTFNEIVFGFSVSKESSNNLYVVVGNDNISIRTKTSNGERVLKTSAHGLNISEFIMCSFETESKNVNVVISTLDGMFNINYELQEIEFVDYYGSPFVEADENTSISDCTLSAHSRQLSRSVLVCGNSLVSIYQQRWPLQLINLGITNFSLIGHAGGHSSVIYDSLLKYMAMNGCPKFLLWDMAMNDDYNEFNCYLKLVRDVCERYGITLILATNICQSRNKESHNTLVKNSGFRYIDFAKAMGSESYEEETYTGYSDDGVHPTTLGAKICATRLISDFPEILSV